MTAPAPFKAHRGVLECKGAALVAMAIEATRLIGGKYLSHGRPEAAMRVMAVDAGHRALGQFVMVGPLKLRPNIGVTTLAQLVNRCRYADDQFPRPIPMNFVAGGTRDRIFGVTALEASYLCWLIQVTRQANSIGRCGGELCRVPDIGSIGGFVVFLACAMAGFATPALRLVPAFFFNRVVGIVREAVVHILVANPACF